MQSDHRDGEFAFSAAGLSTMLRRKSNLPLQSYHHKLSLILLHLDPSTPHLYIPLSLHLLPLHPQGTLLQVRDHVLMALMSRTAGTRTACLLYAQRFVYLMGATL